MKNRGYTYTKIVLPVIAFFFMFTESFAGTGDVQDPALEVAKPLQVHEMFFEPSTYLWILITSILIAVIITLTYAISVLSRSLAGEQNFASIREEAVERKVVKDSMWKRWMNSLTKAVPVEKEADVMLDHNYDGIKELDNQLPPWWVWGFYLTIAFSIVYMVHYHISGTGKLQDAEYFAEMERAELVKAERLSHVKDLITEATVVQLSDAKSLVSGKEIYIKNCVACHGEEGQGGVGPNLADDFYLHGGGIKNVFKVIQEGVPAKGMISWKSQLSPAQIQEVSSFIMSIHGSNPAGAKEAQGERWVAVAETADSVALK